MIRHVISRCSACAGPVRHAPGEVRTHCVRCRFALVGDAMFRRLALTTLTRTR